MGKLLFNEKISLILINLYFLTLSIESRNFSHSALIIVDVQNDFCAGGPLAIPHADEVIPVINKLRTAIEFGQVVFTMDYHPPNHVSFHKRFVVDNAVETADAEANPETKSFTKSNRMPKLFDEHIFDLSDGMGCRKQKLWPVHCVENTTGAELRIGLIRKADDIIIHKGTNPNFDSYSGFMDNDQRTETELDSVLKSHGVTEIFVTGLALEFCVGNTALDGIHKGYKVSVIRDATGSFGYPLEIERTLRDAGIKLISSDELIQESRRTNAFLTPGCKCESCNCPICTCVENNTDSGGNNGPNLCKCPNCICPACSCNFHN